MHAPTEPPMSAPIWKRCQQSAMLFYKAHPSVGKGLSTLPRTARQRLARPGRIIYKGRLVL